MAVKATYEVTVIDQTDAKDFVTWYQLSTSATKPSKPTTTSASATPPGWTKAEPTYDPSQGTKYLYTCQQLVWGDGTCGWGDVQLSSSYEAAKAASNAAVSASASASAVAEAVGTVEAPYTEVEWVESDGKEFCQLDWVPSAGFGFDVDFELKGNTFGGSASGIIFGCRDGANSPQTGTNRIFSTWTDGGANGTLRIPNSDTSYLNRDAGMYTDGRRQQASLRGTTYTKPNGGTLAVVNAGKSPAWGMTVFAGSNMPTRPMSYGNIEYWAKVRIYSLKFYDGDALAVDLVGAVRKSDNVTGLYDRVAGKFWACRGLSCGPSVRDLGTPRTIEDMISRSNVSLMDGRTKNTRLWVAEAPTLGELEDGQQISIRTMWSNANEAKATELAGYADSGTSNNCYLKLALSSGDTDWVPMYYSGETRLTSHYAPGNDVRLTYRENSTRSGAYPVPRGWWADANYVDGNTTYTKYSDTVIAGKNGLKRYTLCMRDDAGNWTSIVNQANNAGATGKTCYTGGLRLGGVLYHAAGGEYAAGANSGVLWESYGGIDLRYSVNGVTNAAATTTLQLRKPVYLVGTIGADDGLLYLDASQWWTQNPNDESKAYVLVGTAYSSYYAIFVAAVNPTYVVRDGELVEITDSRFVDVNAELVRQSGSIALKADASNVYTKEAANALLEVKANKATLTSEINASADTVKINADRLSITGDAVFSAINNDTGTTKISGGKIDATSITIGQSQVTNLTTDLAAKADQSDVDDELEAIQDNINSSRNWYATCDSAAGDPKVATITPATTDFTLTTGATVNVRFANTNSLAVSSLTLNVNGTGAKNIKYIYNNTIANLPGVGYLIKNGTYQFVYDGTYWQIQNMNYNTNDNYYDREAYKAALAASSAISAARIAVLGTDGKLKLLSASAFDIAGPVVYVGTAYTSAEATAGTTKTNNYTFWGTAFNLTSTHAIAGAAAGKPVYIVGTLSGKLFTPNSTVLTCTVPSSSDGLVYMRLGIMSTATYAVLESHHPLYMYFNGAFQQCDPATADAAKTATNYISIDPTNGIRIASANPSTATTYQHQTATETEFVVDGTSQLWMGTSGNVAGMRIGQASQGNVYASGDGYVDVRNSSTVMAHFGYGEGNTGSGTSTAPYYTLGTRKTTTTAFSTSSTYEVGDRVLYGSVEYVCHSAVTTAGDWTGTLNWWVAIGNYSVAEGKDVIACGALSHAEGRNVITIGVQSHAEGGYGDFAYGYPTMAVGISSHAEGGGPISRDGDVVTGGGTQAIGSSSHAEGSGSVASNSYSHAEGYSSVASGIYSHAEGYRSVASGSGSHAQNSNTIAAGKAQTAIGMYNVEDTNNTYALIIGNGLPDYDRSNALTVDWSGNVDMGPLVHAVGSTGSDIGLIAECEDTDVQVRLVVGSGGTNHGVYSDKLAKWLLHGDASNVYLNGKNVSSVAKNRVFASPNGSTGEASFRALVAADLPTVTIAKGGTGVTERQESTVTVTTANATAYNNVNYCWHNGIVGSVQLAVDLKAALANGSTLAIGTVPSGYRPPHAVYGSLYTTGTVVTGNIYASLNSSGTITLNNRSGGNIGTNTNIYMSFTYAM